MATVLMDTRDSTYALVCNCSHVTDGEKWTSATVCFNCGTYFSDQNFKFVFITERTDDND